MEQVIVTSDTAAIWSVELPYEDGSLYLDGADGCLIATQRELAAVTADGQVRWSHEVPFYRSREPLARDGRIYRIEDGHIVARDLATGLPVASIDVGADAFSLDFDPWGGFVFREEPHQGEGRLRSVTADGTPRWAVPMPHVADALHLRLLGDLIVVDMDNRLRAYDRDGRLRWVSWPHLWLTDPDPAEIPPAEKHDDVADLLDYDGARLLTRWEWRNGGGYYLVDEFGRSTPYITTRQVRPALAVLPSADGPPRLAVQGPHRQEESGFTYTVWMVDGDRVTWTHELGVAPTRLRPGAGGTLLVSSTPTQRRWDTYHWLKTLWHETFVRCLAPDGSTRWTWYAPGVITLGPLARPDGVVLVAAGGRLYGLPA
ncbi:hypothetical protein GCM10009679_55590 [Saccharothrix algeriensis]|uniref:PQQ-binding-like beta-propeller repeat protein n=1 Tax=Catellatospora bangladeshensis TaxID=310355 RepID=A0A8J3NML4_9ACTN|nr:hypothetical protein Cba03nite_65020 [Catellatospora bangladeshensis]